MNKLLLTLGRVEREGRQAKLGARAACPPLRPGFSILPFSVSLPNISISYLHENSEKALYSRNLAQKKNR